MGGLSWEEVSGRDDPAQRFKLYRLCECEACGGAGKVVTHVQRTVLKREPAVFGGMVTPPGMSRTETQRCRECRGEGRVRELVATAGSPEAVGVALVRLGNEGEWEDCPVGLYDATPGEDERHWILLPWLPSPRNVSDAGRLLRSKRS